jgi:DNA-binding MarR family transcriptional regulator
MMSKRKKVADIIDNIRRVFQAVHEYSKKAEKKTGLTGPQLWAMKILADTAPIKVSQLAKSMYLHPATVVGILDRLEVKGLIARTRSKGDRRVVEIDLTNLGREILERAPEVAQGLLVAGLETLPDKDLVCIADGLSQLVKILGVQEIPPGLLLITEGHESNRESC